LSCAVEETHGKKDLCRAFFIGHGKQDLCRAFLFGMRPIKIQGKKDICCAPEIKRTTKILTHGKGGFSHSEVLRSSIPVMASDTGFTAASTSIYFTRPSNVLLSLNYCWIGSVSDKTTRSSDISCCIIACDSRHKRIDYPAHHLRFV
jgi:hypothetical protein